MSLPKPNRAALKKLEREVEKRFEARKESYEIEWEETLSRDIQPGDALLSGWWTLCLYTVRAMEGGQEEARVLRQAAAERLREGAPLPHPLRSYIIRGITSSNPSLAFGEIKKRGAAGHEDREAHFIRRINAARLVQYFVDERRMSRHGAFEKVADLLGYSEGRKVKRYIGTYPLQLHEVFPATVRLRHTLHAVSAFLKETSSPQIA